MQQLQAIHRLETEIVQTSSEVKRLVEGRNNLITDLPEYQTLQEAIKALEEARGRFKLAVRDDRDLARLDVDIAETRFTLRDLREQLSLSLVHYYQDTGQQTIRDSEERRRQIELHAKYATKPLGTEPLPLGLGRRFNAHIDIPTTPDAQHLISE
jgi:hypothetical protein